MFEYMCWIRWTALDNWHAWHSIEALWCLYDLGARTGYH